MAMRPRLPGGSRASSDSTPQMSHNGPSSSVAARQTPGSSSLVRRMTEEKDYGSIVAQTATNLKAIRVLFSEEENEPFPGFRPKLAKLLKEKHKGIKREMNNLQNQLKHSYGKRSSAAVREAVMPGSSDSEVPTLSKLAKPRRPRTPKDPKGFCGFNADDSVVEILNKKRRLLSYQIQILSSETESSSTFWSDSEVKGKKTTKPVASSGQSSSTGSNSYGVKPSNAQVIANGSKSSANDTRQRAQARIQSQQRANNGQQSTLKTDSDNDSLHKENKNGTSIVPMVDGVNFFRLKGARVKQVSYCSGLSYGLPRATFGDLAATYGHANGNGCTSSLKPVSEMPSTFSMDTLRSGKFAATTDDEDSNLEDIEIQDFEEYSDLFNADGEILLDRQGGCSVRMRRKRTLIKPLAPIDMSYVDSFGFPIVIDRSVGSLPPKPLCFLCGSAGIEQLIFCSSCCEPYHPYCTNDKTILSLFVARKVPKSKPLTKDTQPKHVKNLNSLLSSQLTPDEDDSTNEIDAELVKKRDLEILKELREWTCHRCTVCQHCGLSRMLKAKDDDDNAEDFLKCWNCRLSFHPHCVSKRNLGKDVKGRWACGDCFKCNSCNKKVDYKTFEACRASNSGAENDQEAPAGKYLFCRECIRKRQRGSFCPVCNVCYDDNDYDTRMMECGSCERWIHGKCENMSEEHYQILSGLPESVEFICRLCEVPGKSIWKRAIKLELQLGCEALLRIFQRKATTISRKSSPMKSDPMTTFELQTAPESCVSPLPECRPPNPDEQKLEEAKIELAPEEITDSRVKSFKLSLRDFMVNPKTEEEKFCRHKFLAELAVINKAMPNTDFKIESTPVKAEPLPEIIEVNTLATHATNEPSTPLDSPTKHINTYIESYLDLNFSEYRFTSVSDLRKATTEFLTTRFSSDPIKLECLQGHFDSASKEVFPWFHSEEIKKSDLEMTKPCLPEAPLSESEFEENTIQRIAAPIKWNPDWEDQELQNPFVDTYWNSSNTTDARECSFCHAIGDSPSDLCGRLLYAGLNEWMHINCALWSSEVWEGENGSLQQVGTALARSKTQRCSICRKFGATISCCRQFCKSTYHFPCAMKSTCLLLQDSSLFCPQHNKNARGDVQRDMEVMRRVFIAPDWIRRKEKETTSWSSNLSVFIGSLRIDKLGHVYPISVSGNHDVTPAQFQCSRLVWCMDTMFDKKLFSISTFIGSKRPTYFCLQAEDITNFVIDHSREACIVEKQLRQLKAFNDWVDICPIYIDEYKTTWFPPCPFKQEDLEADGNDADIEDNVQKEDLEIQTSFSECSTRGSSLSPGQSDLSKSEKSESDMSEIMEEIFTEYLVDDLNSFADDISDLMSNEAWTSTTFLLEKEQLDKMFVDSPEEYRNEFMQVDGACGFSSSSESEHSDEEQASNRKSDSPRRTPDESIRRATRATQSNSQGRLLRSRKKPPQLQQKPEEHKCQKCKKTFQTSGSLNRHIRSKHESRKEIDKPRKIKVRKESVSGQSGESGVESRRGKLPKGYIEVSDVVPTPTTSKGALESMLARTARKQALMSPEGDSDSEESDESSESESTFVVNQRESSSSTSTPNRLACKICRNIYRTEESLRKHLETCSPISSSEGDDIIDEVDQVDDSVMAAQPHQVVPIPEPKPKDEETETEPESEDEPAAAATLISLSQQQPMCAPVPFETSDGNEVVPEAESVSSPDQIAEPTQEVQNEQRWATDVVHESSTVANSAEVQPHIQPEAERLYSNQPLSYGMQFNANSTSNQPPSDPSVIQNLNLSNDDQQNSGNVNISPAIYYSKESDTETMTNSVQNFVPAPAQVETNAAQNQPLQYGQPIPSSGPPTRFVQLHQNPDAQVSGLDTQALYLTQVQQQQLQQQERFLQEQHALNPGPIFGNEQQQQLIQHHRLMQNSGYLQQQQQMSQEGHFGISMQQPMNICPQSPVQQFQNVLIQDTQGNIRQVRVPVQNSPMQQQPQQQQITNQLLMPQSSFPQNSAQIPQMQRNFAHSGSMPQPHDQIQSVHQQLPAPQYHGSLVQPQPQLVSQQQYGSHAHFHTQPMPIAPHPHPNEPCNTFPQHQVQQSANSNNVTYVVLRPDSGVPLQMGQAANGGLPQPQSQHSHQGHVHMQQNWAQSQPRLMDPGPSTILQVLQPHGFACQPNSSTAAPAPSHMSCSAQAHDQSSSRNAAPGDRANQCACSACQSHEKVQVRYIPNQMPQLIHRSPEISQQKKVRRPRTPAVAQTVVDKKGQRIVIYRTRMTPPKMILPATTSLTQSASATIATSSIAPSIGPIAGTSTSMSGKGSSLNPNVAVVRPMEHPLMSIQKMSEKIEQVAPALPATPTIPFISAPTAVPIPTTAPQTSVVLDSSEQVTGTNQEIKEGDMPQNVDSLPGSVPEVESNPTPASQPCETIVAAQEKASGNKTTTPATPTTTNKAIKITLKRKEGGDSYSINSFSSPGSQVTGTMRSLKIKAKITSGEQAGTSTDVEVQPVVHTVPIPNESEENPTVCEDLKIENTTSAPSIEGSSLLAKSESRPKRLTHKAVVVYRVKCNNEILFQSSDVHAVWSLIFEMVQGKRVTQTLPPLSYPATNISLTDNLSQGQPSFNQLGLQHRAVQFLLEQLPGTKKAAQGNQEFKFHDPSSTTNAEISDVSLPENPSGCTRTEGYQGRKPFDMFGWLASKERRPLTDTVAPPKSTEVTKVADLPLAMKFRNMKKAGVKHLQVYWSVIHGRGLFTTKDIECGEMIIEYAGELIRSSLCDSREKYYESKGIGCYMFRIDEDQYVVDATMKGNAARFINHSCDPNCRSKITEIFGKRRILIFALRKIQYGEELTYDYKFPYEDVKIPCSCGTAKCKKFLN